MNFKKKNAANAPAPNQAQQAARRRSLRSGAYASVLAVVVLVLVILLNLVVGAVPTKFTQFDISTGKMFTLSDTTKTMLQELNTDVTAYYRRKPATRIPTLREFWTAMRAKAAILPGSSATPRCTPPLHSSMTRRTQAPPA